MKRTKTARGFRLYEFKDHYGNECTLQASSLADKPCVWLGIGEPKVQMMASQAPVHIAKGETTGWVPVPLPDGTSISSRMHLTQKQVRALLPKLTAFAKTGELP